MLRDPDTCLLIFGRKPAESNKKHVSAGLRPKNDTFVLNFKRKKTMLIGREKEKQVLQGALYEEYAQFIAVYGMQRIHTPSLPNMPLNLYANEMFSSR